MIRFQSIIPVSLFKRDTKEYLSRLEHLSGPLMLTVHGRGAFVVEHINSYINLAELAELARQDRAIEGMLTKMERGG